VADQPRQEDELFDLKSLLKQTQNDAEKYTTHAQAGLLITPKPRQTKKNLYLLLTDLVKEAD